MTPELIKQIIEQVVVRYLSSDDFNGQRWSSPLPTAAVCRSGKIV
jgi:hypothetical protein